MIRNEPWEPPAALHDMQQQIKTIHDENKQQWYDRTQHNAGTPPLWLGFYDPEEVPADCEAECTGPCLDLQIPSVSFDDVVIEPDAVRVEVAPICAGGIARVPLPNNPGKIIEVYGGMNCCYWQAYIYEVVGHEPLISFRPSTGVAPCAGNWHWAVAHGIEVPTVDGDLTATEVDCDDPPPTPTGTGSPTGSPTGGGDPCTEGSPPSFYWSAYGSWYPGWYPLDYPCVGPCYGAPPPYPGTYEGQIATGSCEEP